VGYLYANFSLPRPLCSRVRPDIRDGQTDKRQTKASLNASALWERRHNNPTDNVSVVVRPTLSGSITSSVVNTRPCSDFIFMLRRLKR